MTHLQARPPKRCPNPSTEPRALGPVRTSSPRHAPSAPLVDTHAQPRGCSRSAVALPLWSWHEQLVSRPRRTADRDHAQKEYLRSHTRPASGQRQATPRHPRRCGAPWTCASMRMMTTASCCRLAGNVLPAPGTCMAVGCFYSSSCRCFGPASAVAASMDAPCTTVEAPRGGQEARPAHRQRARCTRGGLTAGATP